VIAGLEVRPSFVYAVAADDDGQVIARARRNGATAETALEAIDALGISDIRALGIAAGHVREPAFTDVIQRLESTVLPRVWRSSPGAAMALAESWRGAARGSRHLVVMTADDTLHAGIILNDVLYEGAHGQAGAVSWMSPNPVDRDDYRRIGGFEAEIGGPGIVRRLIARIKSGDASSALEMAGGDVNAVTVSNVFDAARAVDPVAESVVRDITRYIGMAVVNFVTILDPEVVVLGGIFADAGDLLLEPVRADVARRIGEGLAGSVRVVAATLGPDGVALGAARGASHAASHTAPRADSDRG